MGEGVGEWVSGGISRLEEKVKSESEGVGRCRVLKRK